MWTKLPLWARVGLLSLAGALLVFLLVSQAAAGPHSLPGVPGSAPDLIIHIADLRFSPQHAGIPPGTKVIWRNDDVTIHQVVAADDSWSSPVLETGEEYSRVFAVPAVVPYHCGIHPEMQGSLVIGPRLDLPLVARNTASNPTPTLTPTATPTRGPASVVIGSAGGTLDAPDNSARVEVPPEALDRKAQFDYMPTTPVVPPEYQDAGNAFDLSASDQQGTPVTQFSKPITLTLRIADDLGGDYNGLGLFYTGAGSESWEEMASEIDLPGRTLTSATDHLTQFAGETDRVQRSFPGQRRGWRVGTRPARAAHAATWSHPAQRRR